ncbi:MAG: hypothetical protein R3D59_18915 [Paracoccaceae bacterium]
MVAKTINDRTNRTDFHPWAYGIIVSFLETITWEYPTRFGATRQEVSRETTDVAPALFFSGG